MGRSVLVVVGVGVAVFTLVVAQIGAILLASAASDAGIGSSATTSFVESRSTQHFLLRYVSADPDEPTEVFALEPGRRGGALVRIGAWEGTLEVLRETCAIVGSIKIEAEGHSFVVVWEDGRTERVPASDVLDAPTIEALPSTTDCG